MIAFSNLNAPPGHTHTHTHTPYKADMFSSMKKLTRLDISRTKYEFVVVLAHMSPRPVHSQFLHWQMQPQDSARKHWEFEIFKLYVLRARIEFLSVLKYMQISRCRYLYVVILLLPWIQIPTTPHSDLEAYDNPSLKELPSSIGNLKDLKKVFLANTAITHSPDSFPDSFGLLENIATLDLSGLGLTALPKPLCRSNLSIRG